jgi:gamma-glutamyltranspeptidase/glutathione hydrolase
MLPQILNLLEGMDLKRLGHNSPAYIHAVVEAIKLAAADRDAYYGDPRFVDVPIDVLLSKDYAERRRASIRAERAAEGMPQAGDVGRGGQAGPGAGRGGADAMAASDTEGAFDTSYVSVVDSQGNAFSATPSDGTRWSPVVPGTGLCPSSRGAQSWADPDHPSSVAPGKRPRLTPNPAIAIEDGRMVMPFGTPGGDVQVQAMAQVFLNMFVFSMDPQSAVEAPRFASYSFPSSFEPHAYSPGRLCIEKSIGAAAGAALTDLGHEVEWWQDRSWKACSVCAIRADEKSGVLHAAADVRRMAYALGW